jgi:hypothetical protein
LKNPLTLGYYRNHPAAWLSENLARIHATDQRFDGGDGTAGDGILTSLEVQAIISAGGNQPKVLQMQLLATYFNLASRQINPDTALDSSRPGITNVGDAVRFAEGTLSLPVTKRTMKQYSDATDLLDRINNNAIEDY